MELFDVIDSEGNPTGQIVSREKAHAEGIPHRTAHIWIIREKEGRVQILLQKRSQNKDSFPGKFDTSSAGHIQAGDEPLESALRELKEELGISAVPEQLHFAGTFPISFAREFHGKMFRDEEIAFVYIFNEPVNTDELILQTEEVESVQWFDLEEVCEKCEKYRDIFGYLPQEFGFYPGFSVQDYLEYMAALKGIGKKETKEKIQELLEIVSLTDVRKKKIVKLSGGMKRRVGIAQALLNEPKVLILDEPTSGLDPGERMRFRNLLSEFGRNRIVLISTHIVSDVEYIATCNAIMKDGKIAAVGETEELVKEVEGKVWNAVLDMAEAMTYETKVPVVNIYNREDGKTVLRYLAERPVISGSEPADARMEDLYLWMFPEQGKEEVR